MHTHPNLTNVTKTEFVSLITLLEEVPDPRVTATVDHDLPDILTIALCTVICGGDIFYNMEEFGDCLPRWTQSIRTALGEK